MALARIGFIYQKSGKYNSALDYFDRAIPLLNGDNKSIEAAKVYRAKGMIYEHFGDHAEPAKYYRLARAAYLQAGEVTENQQTGGFGMAINQHLADIATKRGNFNRAVIYQNQVIKALTILYQDSLQKQAESFNDLLNKEIKSSKDTIFIDTPEVSKIEPKEIHWSNWRHILIGLLIVLLLLIGYGIRMQRESITALQLELRKERTASKHLSQQNEEMQTLNRQLTKTEKEQRQASITKDKIFSIISHDLRSPVNTIAGFLNILGHQDVDRGRYRVEEACC